MHGIVDGCYSESSTALAMRFIMWAFRSWSGLGKGQITPPCRGKGSWLQASCSDVAAFILLHAVRAYTICEMMVVWVE